MNLPAKLRKARIIKEYSMLEVAKLAGIARSTYSRYEHGTSEPNSETLAKLIKVLDIDANDSFHDEDSSRSVNAYVIE